MQISENENQLVKGMKKGLHLLGHIIHYCLIIKLLI